jgi:ProP effector
MHEGIDLLAELYPRCFCSTNRRPLKIGVCEEVISQHPEMSRHRIKRLLRKYTQRPEYWSTLKAGAPRIDLDGNVAGEVTLEDEQDAQLKIAKAERSLKAIEADKAANQAAAEPTIKSTPAPAVPPRRHAARLRSSPRSDIWAQA